MSRTLFSIAAVAILTTAGLHSMPASAACPLPPMTGTQARLVDKAAQGITPLRRYVSVTQPIYQHYLPEVVAWIDARRAAERGCATAQVVAVTVAAADE